jgi:hypothetical protein
MAETQPYRDRDRDRNGADHKPIVYKTARKPEATFLLFGLGSNQIIRKQS